MTETGERTAGRGLFSGWIIVGAVFLIVVVSSGIFMSFGVFLNPLMQAFGWTRGRISLAYSIFMIGGGICTLLVGGMLERYSVRLILLIGGLLHAIGIMLTVTTRSVLRRVRLHGAIWPSRKIAGLYGTECFLLV